MDGVDPLSRDVDVSLISPKDDETLVDEEVDVAQMVRIWPARET
jgi:hypothetical protein